MNEAILFVVVVMILLLAQFVMKRIKQPLAGYIKIVSTIIFLVVIWFFGNQGQLPMKIILTTVILIGLYREYLSIKKAPLSNGALK